MNLSQRFIEKPVMTTKEMDQTVKVTITGETDLIVLGEQWILPDVGEIEPDKIFLVPLDTLLRHGQSFSRLGMGTICASQRDGGERSTRAGTPHHGHAPLRV